MTVGQIFWLSCQHFKYIGNEEKDVNDVIMQDLKDMVVLKFKTSLWGRWRNCRYTLTIPSLMGVKFAEFLCSALEGGTLWEIKSCILYKCSINYILLQNNPFMLRRLFGTMYCSKGLYIISQKYQRREFSTIIRS